MSDKKIKVHNWTVTEPRMDIGVNSGAARIGLVRLQPADRRLLDV